MLQWGSPLAVRNGLVRDTLSDTEECVDIQRVANDIDSDVISDFFSHPYLGSFVIDNEPTIASGHVFT